MRKKLIQLFSIMLVIITAGVFISNLANADSGKETMKADSKLTIVTTIYPVYLIDLNLTDGMNDIEVKSLINRSTGCLHDYQLTAEDMKVIASADVMVINGGGMEGFLQDITDNYPELKIIDASKGIELLGNSEIHEGDAEGKESGSENSDEEYNSHVWLDPALYEKQIENVEDELIDYIKTRPKFKSSYDSMTKKLKQNAGEYISKVHNLENELESCKSQIKSGILGKQQQAVIFHEAFAYLANRMGISIAFSIELGPDTSLSAGMMAKIVKEIKKDSIHYLFTEEQYSDSIPSQIANETDASVYIIDSVVTGDGSKDSYLKAMYNNLKVIKEASE